jgi:ABC-2 type transport system ATP-binding protein
MAERVLSIEKLSKTFRRGGTTVQALKSISLSVEAGEVFALLGPNGSGKTTTLNILSGLLDADEGSYEILGRGPRNPEYFSDVSFMSGDSEYYWAFTVTEILKFYCRLTRVPWTRVLPLLEKFSLTAHLDRDWSTLSNGEQTRLRLVQALMTDPKILFLDEPTVGLDPDIQDTVRTELKELNRKGMTLFLTSHYMKDIDTLASKIAFIRRGEILEIAPRAAFGTMDQLEAKFIAYAREEVAR